MTGLDRPDDRLQAVLVQPAQIQQVIDQSDRVLGRIQNLERRARDGAGSFFRTSISDQP